MERRRSTERSGADSRARVGQALFGLIAGGVARARGEVSLTSLSTLGILERTGPKRITDLAAAEHVTQPAMTKLVTVLAHAGLVERRGDPSDKRVALVELTAAGSSYIATRRRSGADDFVQLIDKLPDGEAALLIAAMPALEHLWELDDAQRAPTARGTLESAP